MHASPSRTQALFRKLQKLPSRIVSDPSAGAVHELRTNIRRVETLIAHMWGEPPRNERKLLKQLDRMRKRAGKVRNIDVQIVALASLKMESVARDKARVMRALEKSRTKREQKLCKVIERELAASLAKRLNRSSAGLITASAHVANHRRRASSYVSAALDKFAALAQQQTTFTEENLHAFRMACKRVRYLAEVGSNEPNAARVIEQLKRIQDSVGEWHDWVTLIQSAQKALARQSSSALIPLLRTTTHAKFLQALEVVTTAKAALLEMRAASPARKAAASVVRSGSAQAADTRAASA